jgi:carbon monoxide dehydrogenase subunit G
MTLKKLTPQATQLAEKLAYKISAKGWAGAVGVCGVDAHGVLAFTGSGSGVSVQADILSAIMVAQTGMKMMKKELSKEHYTGLLQLMADGLNDIEGLTAELREEGSA